MDRALEPRERQRQTLRRAARIAAVIVVAIVGLLLVRSWIRPSLRRSRVRTAAVERGPVEAAILCSGQVVAGFEEVIVCPFDTRVRAIIRQPGAAVGEGEPLVELDSTDARLRVFELEDRLALKGSEREQLVVSLLGELARLRGEQEVQRERLTYLEAKTAQQRALHGEGLTAIGELRQAELDETVARIELRELDSAIERAEQVRKARLEGLAIEERLLQKQLVDQRERLQRAAVSCERAGVLTWVVEEVGATLREGDVVARVADLSSFRVEATASDLHSARIAVGQPARVVVSGETLPGTVSQVPPAVQGGVMELTVDLDEPTHASLRSNLRVDVWVVTQERTDALRVAKGPFASGSGEQQVFVVHGSRAERRPARFGLAGMDHYEVLDGLAVGDVVIISDMKDYLHLERVRIR